MLDRSQTLTVWRRESFLLYSCGFIAKHLFVFTVRCHNIMHTIIGVPISFSASLLGHVIFRVTHYLDIARDMGFGSSKHNIHTAGSCVPLPQWPFDILPARFFYDKRCLNGFFSFWESLGRPQPRQCEDKASLVW